MERGAARRTRLEVRHGGRREGRGECVLEAELGEAAAAEHAGGDGGEAALADGVVAEVEVRQRDAARQDLAEGFSGALPEVAVAQREGGEGARADEGREGDGLTWVGEADEHRQVSARQLGAPPVAQRRAQGTDLHHLVVVQRDAGRHLHHHRAARRRRGR